MTEQLTNDAPPSSGRESPVGSAQRALFELRRRLLPLLVASVVVLAVLGLYADVPSLFRVIGAFDWRLAPLAIALTVVNYLLRFAKWGYYLRLLQIDSISSRKSSSIFMAGLAMVITPAKLGEWLKSYLLREAAGVPISRSAPVVVA